MNDFNLTELYRIRRWAIIAREYEYFNDFDADLLKYLEALILNANRQSQTMS